MISKTHYIEFNYESRSVFLLKSEGESLKQVPLGDYDHKIR